MLDEGLDDRLRAAARAHVEDLSAAGSDLVRYRDLLALEFEGKRVPLVGQTGIRKVQGFEAALTILTAYRARPEDRPYEDVMGEDKFLRYMWRGDNGEHADNRALRRAMEVGKPLIWFVGAGTGDYVAQVGVLPRRGRTPREAIRCCFGQRPAR